MTSPNPAANAMEQTERLKKELEDVISLHIVQRCADEDIIEVEGWMKEHCVIK